MPGARIATGLALAAACFAATLSALPRPPATVIEPEVAASAVPSLVGAGGMTPEPACNDDLEASTCASASDLRYASMEVGACVAPAATLSMATFSTYVPETARSLTCEREIASRIAQR
jgi:hypothetical protein